MADKMFQERTWTEIEDLWSFFQLEISKACIETVYGSAILKTYPKLVRDYWDLDSSIEELLRGLPQFMAPSAHAARERLHQNLKEWLEAVHKGDRFAKTAEEDSDWDENMGSKYFQERDAIFARGSWSYEARVAETLFSLHQ